MPWHIEDEPKPIEYPFSFCHGECVLFSPFVAWSTSVSQVLEGNEDHTPIVDHVDIEESFLLIYWWQTS